MGQLLIWCKHYPGHTYAFGNRDICYLGRHHRRCCPGIALGWVDGGS